MLVQINTVSGNCLIKLKFLMVFLNLSAHFMTNFVRWDSSCIASPSGPAWVLSPGWCLPQSWECHPHSSSYV